MNELYENIARLCRNAGLSVSALCESAGVSPGILSDLKEYLSYSSDNPERHFVKTDNTFTRKARLLQAIRRWQSGAECGSFVRKGINYYHPNLAVGGEQSGCNFLHPVIFNYAKFRVNNKKPYETIE